MVKLTPGSPARQNRPKTRKERKNITLCISTSEKRCHGQILENTLCITVWDLAFENLYVTVACFRLLWHYFGEQALKTGESIRQGTTWVQPSNIDETMSGNIFGKFWWPQKGSQKANPVVLTYTCKLIRKSSIFN